MRLLARKMGSWMNGLYDLLKDSSTWIISSDEVVVVEDKFPKAKYHFLVLPREKIPEIFDVSDLILTTHKFWNLYLFICVLKTNLLQLTRNHLNLLKEMYLMARNVIEVKGQKLDDFNIGYHAVPSMLQAHLHVISTDFNSPSLKTKKHWNSFTTEYFIPHEGKPRIFTPIFAEWMYQCSIISFVIFCSELVRRIEVDGKVSKLNPTVAANLLKAPMKCHRCNATLKNIPDLKSHLLKHL